MKQRRKQLRGGVALVLVISAIAIASVLGFALLSGAMLQTRTRGNATRSAQAEYLAESGINLAMYYLQNPDQAPALNASGYWGGTGTDVTVGNGTINVTVVQDSSDNSTYEVTSVASVGDPGSTGDARMTRTEYARLNVVSEYVVKYGTGVNTSMTVGRSLYVSGDAICNGTLTLSSGGVITGTGYCNAYSLAGGSCYGGFAPLPAGAVASPTNNDVNLYQTYTSGGTTYSATQFASGTTTLSGQTYGSSASNPAGIWYSPGALTIDSNVTINGTLVVNGAITLNGTGIKIVPTPGYPAVITTNNLVVNQGGKTVEIDGVCYVGGQLTAGPLAFGVSKVTINGSLLINGGIASSYSSSSNVVTDVYYSASDPQIQVPELSSVGRSPVGIKVVRWGPVVAAPY